jgi:hypothetical protein
MNLSNIVARVGHVRPSLLNLTLTMCDDTIDLPVFGQLQILDLILSIV